jgi:hypothetical protein
VVEEEKVESAPAEASVEEETEKAVEGKTEEAKE